MSIMLSGSNYILDKESEDHIIVLAEKALKDAHKDEYNRNLLKFREIVFVQEVAKMKKFLETRHPEQVNAIVHLRAILNHEKP